MLLTGSCIKSTHRAILNCARLEMSLVFRRKDLREATPKTQSVFKFSHVLFTLSQTDPTPIDEAWIRLTFLSDLQVRLTIGQMSPPRIRLQVRLTFGQTSGQADLWSDVPPRISLPVRLTFDHTLCQADLWSDVPPRIRLQVKLTFW